MIILPPLPLQRRGIVILYEKKALCYFVMYFVNLRGKKIKHKVTQRVFTKAHKEKIAKITV